MTLPSVWPGLEHLVELLIVKAASHARFFHASCVEFGINTIAFVGSTTSGKTTLSQAFRAAGAQIICDDRLPVCPQTGSVYPFLTKPTLREWTRKNVVGTIYTPIDYSEVDGIKKPVRLSHLFFLKSPSSCDSYNSREIGNEIIAWKKMLRLVDVSDPDATSDYKYILKHSTPSHFDTSPQVAKIGPVYASRLLMNHMHPPVPGLQQRLQEMTTLLCGVKTFELRVGDVNKTVSLILKTIAGRN